VELECAETHLSKSIPGTVLASDWFFAVIPGITGPPKRLDFGRRRGFECNGDVATVGLTTYRSPGLQKSGDLGLETLLTIKGTKKQEGTLVAISQSVFLATEFALRGWFGVVH
jgi:hypothetical protein